MFTNHMGDAILEYVVLGALVLAVIGVVAYTIATKAGSQGTATGNWINSIAAPSTHP